MSATDATPDEQRLRAGLRKAVLGRICNVSNLPDWMQTPALGQNMGPLAEIVVDALLPVIAADRERYAQQRAAEVVARVEAVLPDDRPCFCHECENDVHQYRDQTAMAVRVALTEGGVE